jgi:hypothetical protein
MTEQRNLKRRVRARMAKTGERYTAARRHVVAEAEPEPFVADPGLADETLREKTGRGWVEWVGLLDAWGAREREHRDIARHLAEEHGVAGWWSQTITVGYERARGLRAPGQRRGGGFEVNVSRTVNVPVERLVAAWVEPEERERWFPAAPLRLRRPPTATTARFDWEDGSTRVVVGFTAKSQEKSAIAIQHERIPDEEAAAGLRSLWKERLDELKSVLEA